MEKREIYLDNAATTRVLPVAIQQMTEVMEHAYGNPSSLHRKGQESEQYVRKARRDLADILMVEPESIFFTSGATESSNTAILGAAMKGRRRGNHILTSHSEHAATRECMKRLSDEGFEIEYIENDATGKILLDDLAQKIRPDTLLVSVLFVNNETGCVNPIREMGKLIHEKAQDCLFHVDAVQGFTKYPLYPGRWQIDLMSVSAHKIGGPKGVGLLYVKRGLPLPSLIVGGGQERGFRSGTENVPGIAGFAAAANAMWQEHETLTANMQHLKEFLAEGLMRLPDIVINGPDYHEGAAHILNFWVKGIRAEVLLHSLEDEGIYLSAGSACSSNGYAKSAALEALGLTGAALEESVRVSFGRENTKEDVEALLTVLQKCLPLLRRFVRK